MTSTRAPSKPWRVYDPHERATTYHRSQRAAYEAVQSISQQNHRAVVYHWEDGDWRLYERCEPVTG